MRETSSKAPFDQEKFCALPDSFSKSGKCMLSSQSASPNQSAYLNARSAITENGISMDQLTHQYQESSLPLRPAASQSHQRPPSPQRLHTPSTELPSPAGVEGPHYASPGKFNELRTKGISFDSKSETSGGSTCTHQDILQGSPDFGNFEYWSLATGLPTTQATPQSTFILPSSTPPCPHDIESTQSLRIKMPYTMKEWERRTQPSDDIGLFLTSAPDADDRRLRKCLRNHNPTMPGIQYPLLSYDMAVETVIVKVGSGDQQQTFKFEEGLLTSSSEFFSTALKGPFKQGESKIINLPDHCPIAFEVFYQYLRGGHVYPATIYHRGKISTDLFWLRTFKLAHAVMRGDLVRVAYDNMHDHFPARLPVPPTQEFIEELFKNDDFPEIQNYVIDHAAYWNHRGPGTEEESFNALLEHENNTAYAVAVVSRTLKKAPGGSKASKQHPYGVAEFSTYHVFGDGPEYSPGEHETASETEHTDNEE